MEPKLWECTVLIPAEQQLVFRVEAHDEQSAIKSIEAYTHGRCTEIEQEPEFEKLKINLSDILIVIIGLCSLVFVIFNYWKFILIFCGVCFLLFLFLIINET
jgi:hypothetical protein